MDSWNHRFTLQPNYTRPSLPRDMGTYRCNCCSDFSRINFCYSEGEIMMTKHNPDLKKFLVRLGFMVAALVLVMYLAKVWFVDQRRADLPSQRPTSRQVDTAISESRRPAGTAQVISWRDAAKHYGEYATVEGTIVATHNSGKACFLNFHPDYKRYFTAVIFASAFSHFPPNPENYYYGKKVRVSGYIKEYKGKPEIILNEPGQIKILK